MASSQRIMQSCFVVKQFEAKVSIIMKIWDYFEPEAKKKQAFSKVCQEGTQGYW